MAKLILQPGKERSVLRRHPWLFAGAIAHLNGRAKAGDTVDIVADDGRPLGRAAFSPKSQIRARMWTFDAEEIIDDAGADRLIRDGDAAIDCTAIRIKRDGKYWRVVERLRSDGFAVDEKLKLRAVERRVAA